MPKDWKIGLVLGFVLVSIATLWLSTHMSLSTKATMHHSSGTAPSGETPPTSNRLSTNESHTDDIEKNQLLTINNHPKLPDLTEREPTKKIKTKKFHIVRKGETLSEISYEYYGSANKWKKIFNTNRKIIKDPSDLKPGTKLIIPD